MSLVELPIGKNIFRAEPASINLLPELLSIEQQAFPNEGWSESAFKKELEVRPDGIRIIRDSGKVIGYVQFQVGYDDILGREDRENSFDGVIGSLAVLQSHKGRGIGEDLLRTAIGDLSEQKVPRIVASTNRLNFAMINLCTKVGFKRKGVTPGFYKGADAVDMEWIPSSYPPLQIRARVVNSIFRLNQ